MTRLTSDIWKGFIAYSVCTHQEEAISKASWKFSGRQVASLPSLHKGQYPWDASQWRSWEQPGSGAWVPVEANPLGIYLISIMRGILSPKMYMLKTQPPVLQNVTWLENKATLFSRNNEEVIRSDLTHPQEGLVSAGIKLTQSRYYRSWEGDPTGPSQGHCPVTPWIQTSASRISVVQVT